MMLIIKIKTLKNSMLRILNKVKDKIKFIYLLT